MALNLNERLQKARRESQMFDVTDMPVDDDDDDDTVMIEQQQQQQQSKKVTQRRQSERLLKRRENDELQSTEKPPSPKKKRGRPPKASTSTSASVTKSSQIDTNAKASATDSHSVPEEILDLNTNMMTKTALSEAIFGLFEDFKKEPGRGDRYSARCILCHKNESRKFFQKGINSNLKGHLQRVSFFSLSLFVCFPLLQSL